MDRVVYILGAGFSRPLGLPLMSDFIDKAKDIFSADPRQYKHFSSVFDSIRQQLAYITLFYNADLDNIEEVLSILTMRNIVGKEDKQNLIDYKNFIIDVIKCLTPPIISPAAQPPAPTADASLISQGKVSSKIPPHPTWILPTTNQEYYVSFVLGLFNSTIKVNKLSPNVWEFNCSKLTKPPAEYSIITLNYDMVLENSAQYVNDHMLGLKLEFSRPSHPNKATFPFLVKLHGSIDSGEIIPPTWNKTVNDTIKQEWEYAFRLLESANHIRFIGYSLPITDTYVRYLFKTSILRTENLKSINVYCLDTDGITEDRYRTFIKLPPTKYRFMNADALDYLKSVGGSNLYNEPLEEGDGRFIASYDKRIKGIVL